MASSNRKKKKKDKGVQLLHNGKSVRKEVISHPERQVLKCVTEREGAGKRVCVCVSTVVCRRKYQLSWQHNQE